MVGFRLDERKANQEPDGQTGRPERYAVGRGGDDEAPASRAVGKAAGSSHISPAHATFFTSPDGTEHWMAYHANDQASDICDMGRTPRIQPFTWTEAGVPDFGTPVALGTRLAVPSR